MNRPLLLEDSDTRRRRQVREMMADWYITEARLLSTLRRMTRRRIAILRVVPQRRGLRRPALPSVQDIAPAPEVLELDVQATLEAPTQPIYQIIKSRAT